MRKTLKTKMNGENIITTINTWVNLLLRYSAAFLDYPGAELEQMDGRTIKTNGDALSMEF